MDRLVAISLLVLVVGCGQGAPVPTTPAPPVRQKILTAEGGVLETWTEEETLPSWPEERVHLYQTGKQLIKNKLLEFPGVAADWTNPIWVPVDLKEQRPVPGMKLDKYQSVAGYVVAPDNSGNRNPRQWSVSFAELNGGRLVPIMWSLGDKEHIAGLEK